MPKKDSSISYLRIVWGMWCVQWEKQIEKSSKRPETKAADLRVGVTAIVGLDTPEGAKRTWRRVVADTAPGPLGFKAGQRPH